MLLRGCAAGKHGTAGRDSRGSSTGGVGTIPEPDNGLRLAAAYVMQHAVPLQDPSVLMQVLEMHGVQLGCVDTF
jgi:hypothetical protein